MNFIGDVFVHPDSLKESPVDQILHATMAQIATDTHDCINLLADLSGKRPALHNTDCDAPEFDCPVSTCDCCGGLTGKCALTSSSPSGIGDTEACDTCAEVGR